MDSTESLSTVATTPPQRIAAVIDRRAGQSTDPDDCDEGARAGDAYERRQDVKSANANRSHDSPPVHRLACHIFAPREAAR